MYIILPLHQRHKQLPIWHGIVVGSGVGSDLEHPNPGISELRYFRQPPKAYGSGMGGAQSPPHFVLIFSVLYYIIVFYFDFVNFSL